MLVLLLLDLVAACWHRDDGVVEDSRRVLLLAAGAAVVVVVVVVGLLDRKEVLHQEEDIHQEGIHGVVVVVGIHREDILPSILVALVAKEAAFHICS